MIKGNLWQDPCEDVLELILRKVSYFDLPSFSAVCSSWYQAKKAYRSFSRPILLSIAVDFCVADDSNRLNLRFRTLPEGDTTDVVVPLSQRYHQFHCIGWSKQMLVLADKKTGTRIVLIDRLFRRSFCLAQLDPLVLKLGGGVEIDIVKVVVLVMPEKESGDELMNNIVVVAFIGWQRKCMAYYRDGSWAVLDRSIAYSDIVARETRLFALDTADSTVKVWEFNQSIVDRPTLMLKLESSKKWPDRDMCPHHPYLVKPMGEKNDSVGDIFVVQRHLIDNSLLNPPESLEDPDFYCYSTVRFQVFKSRLVRGANWVEVDSLGDDVALFLGGNESVFVSIRDLPKGYQGNSIYFALDYGCNLEYYINSSEIGVYSLEHKNIKFFRALDDHPLWMV